MVILAPALAVAVAFQSCSDSSTVPEKTPVSRAQCSRTPLAPSPGAVLNVATLVELENAVEQANASGDVTILLADGTYELRDPIRIFGDRVAVRGASGNRDAVIIRGPGMSGSVTHNFVVYGDAFIVADMTVGWTQDHAVQLVYDNDDAVIHNVRFVDTGAHMLKVTYRPGSSGSSDDCVVEWCLFEYTAGIGPASYIGGIDARFSKRWMVRHNVFKSIRSPEGDPSGYAIHFRSQSSETRIEYNTIVNCDRGIGLGLGGSGHLWGLVANNMIYTSRDVGMRMENVFGTLIYNNSLYTDNYDYSIEYRYDTTREISIMNNLSNEPIWARDGATGTVSSNVTVATSDWFADYQSGNLHLAVTDTLVIDRGLPLLEVPCDIDCQARPRGTGVDIGADER